MRTKLVLLLAVGFALLVSQVVLAQYTGGSADGYAMGTSSEDSSLPVELSAFSATTSGGNITLKWRTESEVNNVGFSIYRSAEKEGSYIKIGFVDGVGSIPVGTNYQFIDEKTEADKTYFYFIEDVDIGGVTSKSDIIRVFVASAVIVQSEFRLLQNFPNPFNPETWLPYHLASDVAVSFEIYNVQGQLMRELDLGVQKAGGYLSRGTAAYWDGRNQVGETVSSGVYFYTLQTGPFQATRRMLLLK